MGPLRTKSVGCALIVVLVAGAAPAVAADKVWTGATDSNFTTGTNWVGGAPASTDNALYDPTLAGGTNADSTVNASININTISLQGGYTGTVTNPGVATTINFATSISVSSGIFQNAGILTGAGALSASGGAAVLGGTSSYTGATTISGGFIFAGSTAGLSANSAFVVNGGTLNLNGFSNTIGSLAGLAAGKILNTNGSSAAATLTTGGNNSSTTYAGTMNDGNAALALVKVGTGTMVLAGANGYTGGTTISGGTIEVTNANSVGATTGVVTLSGGTFKLDGSVTSVAFDNGFKINNVGGTIDNNGGVAAALTLNGVISNGNGGTGVLQLIDSANGVGRVTILAGANTYSGGTRVVDTTVQVTNSQSVGSASDGKQRGRDHASNVVGCRRPIVVDFLGLRLAVLVTAASVDDATAAVVLSN